MAEPIVNHGQAEPPRKKPLVQRISWHRAALDDPRCAVPARQMMDFLDLSQDVARGVSAVADILLQQDLHDENEEPSEVVDLVDPGTREALLRLAAVSADMLQREADRLATWAYDYHTPEGRAEQRRRASRAAAVVEVQHGN